MKAVCLDFSNATKRPLNWLAGLIFLCNLMCGAGPPVLAGLGVGFGVKSLEIRAEKLRPDRLQVPRTMADTGGFVDLKASWRQAWPENWPIILLAPRLGPKIGRGSWVCPGGHCWVAARELQFFDDLSEDSRRRGTSRTFLKN